MIYSHPAVSLLISLFTVESASGRSVSESSCKVFQSLQPSQEFEQQKIEYVCLCVCVCVCRHVSMHGYACGVMHCLSICFRRLLVCYYL